MKDIKQLIVVCAVSVFTVVTIIFALWFVIRDNAVTIGTIEELSITVDGQPYLYIKNLHYEISNQMLKELINSIK